MCLINILEIIKSILLIIGILVGGYISIKYYTRFAPDLNYRITPLWSTLNPNLVVIKIEIENKSKVKMLKESIRLKINIHQKESINFLTEWVEIGNDYEEICKTTKILYPGSILKVERLYACNDDQILQGLIQFKAKFSYLEKKLANINDKDSTWSSTFIIAK